MTPFHKKLGNALCNLARNFRVMMRYDLSKKDAVINNIANQLLLRDILHYYSYSGDATPYKEELKFLEQEGQVKIFPYATVKNAGKVETGFDKALNMWWVMHNGKKLYLPEGYVKKDAEHIYRTFIEQERILERGDERGVPHQYQSGRCGVEDGDVLVDVGSAEGLFALDVIEKVKKVYLIEADERWGVALKATFEPWKDKVVIINKYVSDKDSENEMQLTTLLEQEKGEKVFVKMDIEGYETRVIESCLEYIKEHEGLKFACCTYHKDGDAEKLKGMFEGCGYETEYSNGYMLFTIDKLFPPYFRHGVIRAKR